MIRVSNFFRFILYSFSIAPHYYIVFGSASMPLLVVWYVVAFDVALSIVRVLIIASKGTKNNHAHTQRKRNKKQQHQKKTKKEAKRRR